LRGVRRQHGDAGNALQALQCQRAQPADMRVNGGAPGGVDEPGRRRQPHGTCHVGGAAFQARGQVGVAGRVPLHRLHHVATQAQRVQACQRAAPPCQHAGAHGAVHLVAREGQKVAVKPCQHRCVVRHSLRRVQHGECARLRGLGQQRLVGRALAAGVGAGGEREHARARREQGRQVAGVQAARSVGLQDGQLGAAQARGLLPGQQVGVVLQPADDDAVARAQPGPARPGGPQALGHEVERLGGARGEDEFVLGLRADELLERGAGLLEGVGGALAQRVHATVDVGAVLALKVELGLLHGQRRLCGGGVVQVGQGLAVDGLGQHRELRAQGLDGQGSDGVIGHAASPVGF